MFAAQIGIANACLCCVRLFVSCTLMLLLTVRLAVLLAGWAYLPMVESVQNADVFNFNLSSDTMLAVQAADEGFKASVWTLLSSSFWLYVNLLR